jgi:hypothetical protein
LAVNESTARIYAAKGNKTGEFYAHEPSSHLWSSLCSIPAGSAGRLPQKGAKGVGDGRRFIYATKGNSTTEFWRYDIVTDSWRQLTPVPGNPYQKSVKDGSDLAFVRQNDTGYAYLLKGGKNEFWRYNTAADRWQALAEAPGTKGWKAGSWLVYDSVGGIYAHKATYHEFYRYDVTTGAWDPRPLHGMPFISSSGDKKSKAGGSAALYAGNIYALKGGKTGEFWKYFVARDSWRELDGLRLVGSTGKKKGVGAGGDLVYWQGGVFYATKGNSTVDFWRSYFYDPLLDRKPDDGEQCCSIHPPEQYRSDRDASISSALPGGPATVSVYDISGRCRLRTRLATGAVLRPSLPTGVYLARFAGPDWSTTRKLIIMR